MTNNRVLIIWTECTNENKKKLSNRQPNKIMAYLTFHKWLVSVCNIHNDMWMVQTKTSHFGKVSYAIILLGWRNVTIHQYTDLIYRLLYTDEWLFQNFAYFQKVSVFIKMIIGTCLFIKQFLQVWVSKWKRHSPASRNVVLLYLIRGIQ